MVMAKRCPALVATGLLLAGALFTLWAMELNWTDVGASIGGGGGHSCYDPRKEGELELLRLELAEAKQRLADQELLLGQQSSQHQQHQPQPSPSPSPPQLQPQQPGDLDLNLRLAEASLNLMEESPEHNWLYVKPEDSDRLERVDVSYLLVQLGWVGANLAPRDPAKRLLVVVPFFNGSAQRWPEASFTIPYYRRYLSLFGIKHEILLVEQAQTGLLFNKGTLFNAAYREFMDGFDYMALMDVDSVPVFYRAKDGQFKWVPMDYPSEGPPYHLALNVEKGYWNPCSGFAAWFAGVGLMFTREHFSTINGFSNNYYGWGSEDDDVLFRVQQKFGDIRRYGDHQGMFHSQPHEIIWEDCDKNNNPRNRGWFGERVHTLEDDGLTHTTYDIVHKGWTNKWGGFHWLRIVPTSPLLGGQVNRLPQEEIDACRAKLKKAQEEAQAEKAQQ